MTDGPNDSSGQSHPTLGELLRGERERRGISIEQVASATKVGVRLLHAIEADQYAELPAKPFIRGFVNSYARFIGLDPQELLLRFDEFIDQRALDRPNREGGHSGYAFERQDGGQSRTVLWFVMGAFLLLGAGAFLILKPSLHHHRSSHVDTLRSVYPSDSPSPSPSASASGSLAGPAIGPVAAPAPSTSTEPLAAASASASPTASASSLSSVSAVSSAPSETREPVPSPSPSVSRKPDPLNSGVDLLASEIKQKLVLKSTGDIWVRYQIDDRHMMRIILREGRVLVLRASREVRLQVSDPDAVSLKVNGESYETFSDAPSLVQKQGTATLFLPTSLGEKIANPFQGAAALPHSPPPPAPGAHPTPAASP